MNLNNHFSELTRIYPGIAPREEKIRETIQLSQEVFFLQEQNSRLSYWDFLWGQLHYTRRRWWALQAVLLLIAGQIIPEMENHFSRIRSIGSIGCLFVVLMIPELWRNKETDSTQVEAACLFSLRQVYAARITLFGIVDIALLTLFSFGLGGMGLSLAEIISQFLLPATVTACICFWLFCGKQNWNEAVSLAACLLFGGAWWLLIMNESIYASIVPAVWIFLFGLSLVFLAFAVLKTVRGANHYWEVEFV